MYCTFLLHVAVASNSEHMKLPKNLDAKFEYLVSGMFQNLKI